ncbi:sulfur carrier protein ThiS [Thermus sediminis]|uniref:sulfur carrier protein ThiS n=1 Tax=Thermus sediminis TaxID=1761908 RepID=UPI000E3D6B89|nr:sulfur carrier protein ThiS [Thermus sediminis]
MVWLNGEARPLEGRSLRDVLEELGVDLERVAVLLNEEAFPGRDLPPYVLKEGDVVEVVSLMQGG